MKRTCFFSLAMVLMVALSLPAVTQAKGDKPEKKGKVTICHNLKPCQGGDLIQSIMATPPGLLMVGHIIIVSEKAVPAHKAHGDVVWGYGGYGGGYGGGAVKAGDKCKVYVRPTSM